jgi:hypothetical protein
VEFCAACGQLGDPTVGPCPICGARTAAAAGTGDQGRVPAPDDTPALDAFGDVQPFGAIFREFRAARSGAWPVRQDAGQEDPYDRLYRPRRDDHPDWEPQPAAAFEGQAPARQHRGGSGDTEVTRPYGAAGRGPAGPGAPQRRDAADPEPPRRGAADPEPPRYYGWMRRPSPAAGSRKRVILAVLAVIALVAGGGGALGYGMYRNRPPPITPAAQGSGGESGPRPASGARPPPGQLGNSTVTVTPAAAGVPAARLIISLLTSYFRAVNTHDYVAYQRLLDPGMKAEMTAARFGTGYRSTKDSQATLTGISAAPDGRATADLVFISHQKPADSPDRSACTNWTLKLFLEQGDGGYRIGESPPGYRPVHQPC